MLADTVSSPRIAMSPEPTRPTRWNVVLLSVGAGVAGACLIGKVPPALPTLRAEFGLSLVAAGWLASLMSVLGASLGIAVGSMVDRLGRRRTIVGALLVMAAGSVVAAFAESAAALFVARFAESVGFVAAVIAAPSIIAEAATREDQRFAFGLWGTYIPTGIAIAMVLTPVMLGDFGWRGASLLAALPALAVALGLALVFRGTPTAAVPARGLRDLKEAARLPGPWIAGAAFSFYAFQWFIVMTWLPTLLVETMGYDARAAGLLTAAVVFVNAFGNVMGGALLARGARSWLLMALVALIQASAMPFAFSDAMREAFRYGAVLVFSFFGGMLPASVFASVPLLAPRAPLLGLVNGLIVQCSNLGSVLGPPVYAWAVLRLGGWDKGGFVLLVASTAVFVLALALRPLEVRA